MHGEPTIAVYATQPRDGSPMQTVFTLGMSDRDIPLGDDRWLRGELAIFLPPDWPLTPEALREERHHWPITQMLRIAREARDSQAWPAMTDPRMAELTASYDTGFDAAWMGYGGFRPLVGSTDANGG